jgi:hypothetical protein
LLLGSCLFQQPHPSCEYLDVHFLGLLPKFFTTLSYGMGLQPRVRLGNMGFKTYTI